MVKHDNLIVRVDGKAKQRIKEAARLAGKSLTTFVLENTMKVVEKLERSGSRKPRECRGACPTFFRICCETASTGGTNGYKWAAYQLTQGLRGLSPDELDANEWGERLEKLTNLLDDDEEDAVLVWFDDNLPRCMALVPRRRRSSFLEGVYEVVEENGTAFE